ncbi:MAG: restriction endonuclease subunit S [Paludibacteraceae bacterium]|nr:restriction endonuclease subunit S [Paludibacteraceae bacterium]
MMKEGWKYKKIKDVGVVIGGTTPSTANPAFWNGNICWISPAELKGEHYLYDSAKKITEEAVSAKNLKELPIGTVILSSRAPIGKLAINKVPMYCNQGFKCIICGNELYNEYLYWWLYGKKDYLNSLGTGATFPEISKSVVENIQIPIPPLPEQHRIVEYLDTQFAKIDALKTNAEQQLQAAKDLFQSALKDLMTPKEGWEMKNLGEVGVFSRGGNFTKSDFVENGIPCIHYGQIHMRFGVTTEKCLTYLPYDFPKIKYAQTGDLIIAITSEDDEGSCKCTAWLGKENVAVGGHIAVFHHQLDPVFMSYFFMSPSFQKDKLEFTHGFKVVEIKPCDIAKIKIAFPTMEGQKGIVQQLDKINVLIENLKRNYEQTLTLCNDLKQSLLKKIFE